MRSTVSVSVRSLLVTLVLLVSVVGAYLIGASGDGGPPAQAATEPAGSGREVSVVWQLS